MPVNRSLGWSLCLAGALALCGCGSSRNRTNPGNAAAVGAASAVTGYFDALQRVDLAGVRAALAPDYSYDRGFRAFDVTNPFDRLLGFRYRRLNHRIQELTTVGQTSTALVTTSFEAIVNLDPIGFGQPLVNGEATLVLELEPRSSVWKLTAIRVVRETFLAPNAAAAFLSEFTVDGQTSLEVPPGKTVRLAGKSSGASLLVASLGPAAMVKEIPSDRDAAWVVDLPAPATSGRYLAHALVMTDDVRGFDHRTLPVTVVNTP